MRNTPNTITSSKLRSAEKMKLIKGVSCRKSDDDPKMDGEKMKRREVTEEERNKVGESVRVRSQLVPPHRLTIRPRDIVKHGVKKNAHDANRR